MTINQTGISNRETPEEEAGERERLRRPDDVARDQAGHLIKESGVDRIEAEDDASVQPPDAEGERGAQGIRRSRAGG